MRPVGVEPRLELVDAAELAQLRGLRLRRWTGKQGHGGQRASRRVRTEEDHIVAGIVASQRPMPISGQ